MHRIYSDVYSNEKHLTGFVNQLLAQRMPLTSVHRHQGLLTLTKLKNDGLLGVVPAEVS